MKSVGGSLMILGGILLSMFTVPQQLFLQSFSILYRCEPNNLELFQPGEAEPRLVSGRFIISNDGIVNKKFAAGSFFCPSVSPSMKKSALRRKSQS